MSDDNIFTLFLKGVFVVILLIMALAFILPFLSSLTFGSLDSEIITTFFSFIMLIVVGLIFLILFKGGRK